MLFPAFCALWAKLPFAVPFVWAGSLSASVAERLDGAEGSRSGKTVWLISTRGASDMMDEAILSRAWWGEGGCGLRVENRCWYVQKESREELECNGFIRQGDATIWAGATVVCACLLQTSLRSQSRPSLTMPNSNGPAGSTGSLCHSYARASTFTLLSAGLLHGVLAWPPMPAVAALPRACHSPPHVRFGCLYGSHVKGGLSSNTKLP
jgi:hypothetical protein